MSSHLAFRSLAHELPVRRSRRARSADDADFVGPLRVLVGVGLAALLWVAFKQSTPFPSDAAATEPDSTKGY